MKKPILLILIIILILVFAIAEGVLAFEQEKGAKVLAPEIIESLQTEGQGKREVLEGDVKIYFQSEKGCSGCGGGCQMDIESLVIEDSIYVYAEVKNCDCSGNCEAWWPAFGNVVIEGLELQEYIIYYPQDIHFMSAEPVKENE